MRESGLTHQYQLSPDYPAPALLVEESEAPGRNRVWEEWSMRTRTDWEDARQ